MSIYSEILIRHAKHPVANNPLLSDQNVVQYPERNTKGNDRREDKQSADQNVVQYLERNTKGNDRREDKQSADQNIVQVGDQREAGQHGGQTELTGQSENTTYFIEFRNRSCGDLVRLSWSINPKSQRIEKLSHHAEGCMLCKASASILCTELQNKTLSEVKMILEKAAKATDFREELPDFSQTSSDFKALSEARQFPTRKKCFTLAWEAFQQGLNQRTSSEKK
ncbi:MAG: iron-sulfur cluster assembly scaffold protein [Balneolales bacterium]|nr:iron-sulfur cluster assembly scaffold protein [Balneolales bacterium]